MLLYSLLKQPFTYLVRMVNTGSLGSIATTMMEKYIGFWSAYLLDLCSVVLCVILVQVAGRIFGTRSSCSFLPSSLSINIIQFTPQRKDLYFQKPFAV